MRRRESRWGGTNRDEQIKKSKSRGLGQHQGCDHSNCEQRGSTSGGRFIDWAELTGVKTVNLAFTKLGLT